MSNPFITRAQSVVNWFRREPYDQEFYQLGAPSLYESFNRHTTSQQSVVSAIYNRIAVDAANVPIKHVYTNNIGDYAGDCKTRLNDVLTVSANYDQTPQAFMVDAILSMFEEGSIAIVPETTANPYLSDSWDVVSHRVAKIINYKPKHVEVEIYNEDTGRIEQWKVPKAYVAIIENPLFYIMNKPNSTLKRLTQAISLLDHANEESVNGKIDLIIHVPFTIRSESRQKIAENRRKDIENQLRNSKYGIAYMDPTETVTQLNRPANNNLLEQVTTLTAQAFTQIGITESILNGTADAATMTNYRSRILGMILKAFTQEYTRKYLTQTARTQKQAIMYIFNAFEFSTAGEMAEIADKFRRNEIATSDELRPKFGLPPSEDPRAKTLANPNLNQPESTTPSATTDVPDSEDDSY